jgi:hypothetical protein
MFKVSHIAKKGTSVQISAELQEILDHCEHHATQETTDEWESFFDHEIGSIAKNRGNFAIARDAAHIRRLLEYNLICRARTDRDQVYHLVWIRMLLIGILGLLMLLTGAVVDG